MIGRLTGTLLWKQAPQLLVDVHGVGYEVEAPMSTFYELPAVGTAVTLHTHLIVREDAHLLFGFATLKERETFRELLKVNGVGPRLAITILSGIAVPDLHRAVRDGDVAGLTRLPGVGKKTAERLVIELRDRLPEVKAGKSTDVSFASPALVEQPDPVADAVSALIALGYKPNEASRMVGAVAAPELACEDMVRRALQAAVK